MTLTVVNTDKTDSDKYWGFPFGEDGFVDIEEAARLLGNASIRTVERRIVAGLIRAGSEGRRRVICRRSLKMYMGTLEK